LLLLKCKMTAPNLHLPLFWHTISIKWLSSLFTADLNSEHIAYGKKQKCISVKVVLLFFDSFFLFAYCMQWILCFLNQSHPNRLNSMHQERNLLPKENHKNQQRENSIITVMLQEISQLCLLGFHTNLC